MYDQKPRFGGPVPPGPSVEPPLISSFQSTRSTILMSATWFSAIRHNHRLSPSDAAGRGRDGRVKRRAAAGSPVPWRTCQKADVQRDGGT